MFIIAGYRDWAVQTHWNLESGTLATDIFLATKQEQLTELIEEYGENIEAIFFVGWSWIVGDNIIDNYDCYCVHPSDLPKFRGGSPIQNQMLSGVTDTKATLFKMDKGLDTGPIVGKQKIWLTGTMEEIFDVLSMASTYLVGDCIKKYLNGEEIPLEEQDESEATYYKRRKPEQSELTYEDLTNCSAEQIHTFIKALGWPYPNAFIQCADGSKLYITATHL